MTEKPSNWRLALDYRTTITEYEKPEWGQSPLRSITLTIPNPEIGGDAWRGWNPVVVNPHLPHTFIH